MGAIALAAQAQTRPLAETFMDRLGTAGDTIERALTSFARLPAE